MSRKLYNVLIAIFAIIFLISAFMVGNYFLESTKAQSDYDEITQLMESGKQQAQSTVPFIPPVQNIPEIPDSTAPDTPVETTATPTILPEYAALYLQNDDMVGWIEIEGTKLNYPVLQTPDEKDFYLYRDFNKESSKHGAIYVQENCDVWTPSDNTVIYGHNMKDGSMFATLLKYRKQSYWEEHRFIYFNTLLERHTYEIIAVFKTSATIGKGFDYHLFVEAEDEEEFNTYINRIKKLSYYDTGVTAEYGDKLITLSTCEYTLTNGRFVVVAKRVSE